MFNFSSDQLARPVGKAKVLVKNVRKFQGSKPNELSERPGITARNFGYSPQLVPEVSYSDHQL